MKRLAHHFFTLCSAASLLLCAAVVWFMASQAAVTVGPRFVRAYGVMIEIQKEDRSATSFPGQFLALLCLVVPIMQAQQFVRERRRLGRTRVEVTDAKPGEAKRQDAARRWWLFCGALLLPFLLRGHGSEFLCLAVPVVVLGLLRLLPLRDATVERRRALGVCTSCGYDLRATPERCPECGTVPTAEGK